MRFLCHPIHVAIVLTSLVWAPRSVEAETQEESPVRVRLKTSLGDIVLELNREKAPQTVNNFLKYVETGFYDDTIFHRVVKGFMIQGGGRTADLKEKKTGRPIRNEAGNGLSNEKFTVAMARKSGAPHSATVQFFINTSDENQFLDRARARDGVGYAVFGKVIAGKKVVEAITKVETKSVRDPKSPLVTMDDVPVDTITILQAMVMEEGEPVEEENEELSETEGEEDPSEQGEETSTQEGAVDDASSDASDDAESP